MTGEGQKASLKAILFADLAQYSLLVGQREAETLQFMQSCFTLIRARCAEFGGELVKTTGDGIIAQFDSASAAVECAVDMHKAIDTLQSDQPDKARFRIGVHLGEVQRLGSEIYGHAVNVAARLEGMAKPGGVCVSQAVYHQARHGTKFGFIAVGTPRLKHIAEAISVYHVIAEHGEAAPGAALNAFLLSVIDGLSMRTVGGEPVPLRSPRVRAVLGYLALATNRRETLDRLATLIWPDRAIAVARRALTRSLRSADDAFAHAAPSTVQHGGGEVALDDRLVEIDLVRIHRSATLGTVDEILLERPDWPDAILSGMDGISQLFSTWLGVARNNWRQKIADALESCIARFDAAESGVRQAAEALLLMEPSHEHAAQSLIRHYDANRNPAAALRVYRNLVALLKERFEIAPSAETVVLIESIAHERVYRPQLETPPPRPAQPPRIGIAKFATEDEAAGEGHIVVGFRNELITNLSRFREWIVFELEGDAPLEGQAGTFDYVLSARGRKAATDREFVVMLMDAGTRRVVWSDAFRMSVDTWFDTQRSLVRRIAACLEVYLSSDRLAKTISLPDNDLSAYDDWLRGEHLLSFWTPEAEDEAARLFESVIARNPNFAPAYASLAGIYNVRHLIRPGIPPDASKDRRALALGKRSVELDPLDARNHLVVGWTSAMARQFEQSALYYDLAVSLNRSSPKVLISCAQGLAFGGFANRAAQLLGEALDLSPMLLSYQWCYVVSTRWLIGDFKGAVEAADLSGNTTVDTPGWRAAALVCLERHEEAQRAFAEQVQLAAGAWAGKERPNAHAIVDWFMSAFPIAREADRAALVGALRRAAGL